MVFQAQVNAYQSCVPEYFVSLCALAGAFVSVLYLLVQG